MQYPYYDYRQNDIDKMQDENYERMQNRGGGHIQYFYQPLYAPASGLVYRAENSGGIQDGNGGYALETTNYSPSEGYGSQGDKDAYPYIEPIQQAREEYSKAIAYQQYQPQVVTTSTLNYHQLPIHIPSTPIYPTQPTYNQQLFKPAEAAPTGSPSLNLDLTKEPHLSTAKQQALLTQYFHNIQAKSEVNKLL